MKKKSIILILSIIFVGLVIYFGIKGTMMLLYKDAFINVNNDIIENYNFPINITTNTYLTGNNIRYEQLSYRNVYSDFIECSKGLNYKMFCLNYKPNNYTSDASIVIGVYKNYIDDTFLKNNNMDKRYYKAKETVFNNSIKTPENLYNYIFKNYKNKVNILSSIKDFQNSYFVKNVFKNIENYSFLSGDLKGFYYKKNENQFNVELWNKEDLYYIYFANGNKKDYFNQTSVLKFLEYIIFVNN